WGSDLFYFARRNGHVERIRAVLTSCDYLITDCERDRFHAQELGFAGKFLGVFPGPGGFDIERMHRFRQPPPEAARRVHDTKGAHAAAGAGRALVALAALVRVAGELRG